MKYDKQFFQQFPREHMSRGGFSEGLGYDGLSVQGDIFHFVYTKDFWLTRHSSDNLQHQLVDNMYGLVNQVNYKLKAFEPWLANNCGEICIRLIWTPPQEVTSDGFHTDICYATIPLYDCRGITRHRVGEPFYGSMAEPYGKTAKVHPFRADKKQWRTYGVAFVQLPMDTVMPDGRLYCDVLNELYSQQRADAPRYDQFGNKI